jgi:hypothetical protein
MIPFQHLEIILFGHFYKVINHLILKKNEKR